MKRKAAILLAMALQPVPGAVAAPGCGDSSTVKDYRPAMVQPASQFLAGLQRAVGVGDRASVAAMIRYPLRVNGVKGLHWITTPAQMLRHYTAIMTPHMKASISTQRAECLFANWQGVMIDNGEVWFDDEAPGAMKIITFNVK
jgi:hypothetical protein